MPSFDVVSKVDKHELMNAVDQANREITNRFDFKGSGAQFKLEEETITMSASSEFQLKQMQDILNNKITKRGLDVRALDYESAQTDGQIAHQTIKIKQGIDKELGKKITKLIKDSKLKVQAAIQGDQIRITGKKRDDLQQVIATLREQKLGVPLQFENFRD